MNCANVRRLLPAYGDAELSSQRRADVRQHLHHCDECAAALDGLKKLSSLMADWADLQAATSPWDHLAARLRAVAATSGQADEVGASSHPKRAGGNGKGGNGANGNGASGNGAGARRSFKPVVEGLEDRYPLSGMMVAAGVAVAVSALEPAAIWSAMASPVAIFHAVDPGMAQGVSAHADVTGAAGLEWGGVNAALWAAA
ncbi:MAG: zf-HC2 domain-containing protein [Gemmataceae bacterium]|nr:zf-HC2 domain-containing protein [Gemmataceae bacterium]